MPVPLLLLLLFPFLLLSLLLSLLRVLLCFCHDSVVGESWVAQVQEWCVYVQNLLSGWLYRFGFGCMFDFFFLVFTPPFYFVLLSNCEPHVLEGCIPSVMSPLLEEFCTY